MADNSAGGLTSPNHPREHEPPPPVGTTENLEPAKQIAQLKQELELIKRANPFRMVEIAIQLEIEKLRVVEIAKARDIALERLSECCITIQQKNAIIEEMRNELDSKKEGWESQSHTKDVHVDLVEYEQLKTHISVLETSNEELRLSVARLRTFATLELPPSYESDKRKSNVVDAEVQTEEMAHPRKLDKPEINSIEYAPPAERDDPQVLVNAREAKLASIPLPHNPPDATLTAIVIPAPFTLHEFLSVAPASLKTALSSYKVLHDITTHWCPEREEHGYVYTPVFKCNTNPRIATAHRWLTTDVIGRMSKPTECFYNKEGVWYYAGSYKAFMMDQLSTKEWAQLPAETTSAIVKETLAARRNVSPQNTYETTQLYAVGALRVACVGLHCVGFNREIYTSIIDHAERFADSKWKSLATASAKILATATHVDPNSTTLAGSKPGKSGTPSLATTAITGRQWSGIPVTSMSANASQSSRGGICQTNNHAAISPPLGLGLGFGSSTWSVWANDNPSSSPSSGVPPVVEATQNRYSEAI